MADDGLVAGPIVVRDDCDFRAGVVEQANSLAAVFQSVANCSIVGIDGDGESRRVAAAEEDDVRAGFNDGVGRELEAVVRSTCCRPTASRLYRRMLNRRYKVR